MNIYTLQSLFDNIAEWIREEEISLSDIFTDSEELIEKIKDIYDIEEIFEEDEMIDYLKLRAIDPEDIFSDDILIKWALDNGFEEKTGRKEE